MSPTIWKWLVSLVLIIRDIEPTNYASCITRKFVNEFSLYYHFESSMRSRYSIQSTNMHKNHIDIAF